VRIWVQDNGIGIPRDQRERIFNLFQRLHPTETYEGTGIGLAIVRKAVERMNGKVGVESEAAGQGSRFWVELARSD
jgi:signal transduction histidine kinase